MTIRRVSVALVAPVLLLVGACSTTSSGSPSATTSAATPTTRLSPPITAPMLDLSAAKAAPCDVVPAATLATLGSFTQDPEPQNGSGPRCTFLPADDNSPLITLGFNTLTGGLEGIYLRRSNFPVFEPLTVAGYPAVSAQPAKQPESCNLNLGVNDQDLVTIDLTAPVVRNPAFADTCARTLPFAADVVAALSAR